MLHHFARAFCEKPDPVLIREVGSILQPGGKLKNAAALCKAILSCVKKPVYYPEGLEAVLNVYYHNGKGDAVISFHKQEPDLFKDHAPLIGAVVMSLTDKDRWKEVHKLLKDYKQFKSMEMWLISNYLMSLKHTEKATLEEQAAACKDILERFAHDHTAWFLVTTLLETHIQSRDFESFEAHYGEYEGYANRKATEDEHCPDCYKDMDRVFSGFHKLLQNQDQGNVQSLVRQISTRAGDRYREIYEPAVKAVLKSRNLRYKRPRHVSSSSSDGEGLSWWWWIVGFVLLRMLIKALSS